MAISRSSPSRESCSIKVDPCCNLRRAAATASAFHAFLVSKSAIRKFNPRTSARWPKHCLSSFCERSPKRGLENPEADCELPLLEERAGVRGKEPFESPRV